MKRFAIIAESPTAIQMNLVTAFLQGTGFQWWHNMSTIWLVVDISDRFDAATLRDEIIGASNIQMFLVLEINQPRCNWAGRGNIGMFEWFNENWSKTNITPASNISPLYRILKGTPTTPQIQATDDEDDPF